jgi:hypothetical protein
MTPNRDTQTPDTIKSNSRRLFEALEAIATPDGMTYQERNDGKGDSGFYDLMFAIYEAIIQALLIAPIDTPDDLYIKLNLAEHLTKRGIIDSRGNINYEALQADEIETLTILNQLKSAYDKTLTAEQRNAAKARKQ